jgi:hypothetical protein
MQPEIIFRPVDPLHQVIYGAIAIGVVTLIIALYLLPSILAFRRHHRRRYAILVVNFFFGWSIVGWIGVLIWLDFGQGPASDTATSSN